MWYEADDGQDQWDEVIDRSGVETLCRCLPPVSVLTCDNEALHRLK